VGRCLLGKRRPYAATLYLIRKYRRGPGRPKRRHGHTDQANVARRRHNEPWLLGTSLVPSPGLGQRVVKWYARRMQIELSFRDAKGIEDRDVIEMILAHLRRRTSGSSGSGSAAEAYGPHGRAPPPTSPLG